MAKPIYSGAGEASAHDVDVSFQQPVARTTVPQPANACYSLATHCLAFATSSDVIKDCACSELMWSFMQRSC